MLKNKMNQNQHQSPMQTSGYETKNALSLLPPRPAALDNYKPKQAYGQEMMPYGHNLGMTVKSSHSHSNSQ